MKTPPPILPAIVATLLGGATALSAYAQTVEELKIETRSTYQSPAERTPFWPIGWAPSDPAAAPIVVKDEVDTSFFTPERFALTSISIDRVPLALINGRPYSVGDLVPITPGHSAEVIAIRDGGAQLRFRDKTIDVPLRTSSAPRSQPPKKPQQRSTPGSSR